MFDVDEKTIVKYFDLKEQYEDKYKKEGYDEYNMYPEGFYSISDYKKLINLFTVALEQNTRIENTDYYWSLILPKDKLKL